MCWRSYLDYCKLLIPSCMYVTYRLVTKGSCSVGMMDYVLQVVINQQCSNVRRSRATGHRCASWGPMWETLNFFFKERVKMFVTQVFTTTFPPFSCQEYKFSYIAPIIVQPQGSIQGRCMSLDSNSTRQLDRFWEPPAYNYPRCSTVCLKIPARWPLIRVIEKRPIVVEICPQGPLRHECSK